VASILADAVLEGRKRFLSYLSQEGVAIKEEKPVIEEPVLLAEEESKIKEIEEIVETTTPAEEEAKPAKKGRARPQDEKSRIKRKG